MQGKLPPCRVCLPKQEGVFGKPGRGREKEAVPNPRAEGMGASWTPALRGPGGQTGWCWAPTREACGYCLQGGHRLNLSRPGCHLAIGSVSRAQSDWGGILVQPHSSYLWNVSASSAKKRARGG